MPFYGYDPGQYVQRDRLGIGGASQIAAKTVADMPGRIREKEQYELKMGDRDRALKEAEKDWSNMETAWKAIKSQYDQRAKPLIASGAMSQEEYKANLQRLRMPTSADKKNAGAYVDNIGKVYGELIGDVKQRERQTQLTGAVQQATQERFGEGVGTGQQQQITQPSGEQFTEETITSRPRLPGAQTQAGIAAQPEVQQLAPTTKELEQTPQYATAPTEQELEKNEIQKIKAQISKDKASNINWYREMMVGIRGKMANLAEDKDELTRMKARKDLVKTDTALISLIDESKDNLKELENPVDEFGDPTEKDYAAIAQEKKRLEDYESLRKQIPGLELQTIKKGTTLNTQTGQTSPATRPRMAPQETGINPMEREIRDTLQRRGVDQQTIEAYIQEKKAKGAL